MAVDIDGAALIAEELKSEKTFDARAAVTGATYPEDKIEVYSDARTAHDINVKAHEAAQARLDADSIKNSYIRVQTEVAQQERTVEDDPAPAIDHTKAPGWTEAEAEAEALEAEVAQLVKKLQASSTTFHLRGLAPKLWELIHAKARKQVKEPARKNFPQDEDGEEEFQRVTYERNIARMHWVDEATVASSIVKVVRTSDGATDTFVWTQEDVANMREALMESEFDKLKSLTQQLTFANNLFKVAVAQDADFLSKR